ARQGPKVLPTSEDCLRSITRLFDRRVNNHIMNRMMKAKEACELIQVANPRCPSDCFTDRWPGNHRAQDEYIRDLRLFLRQLTVLFDESLSMRDRAKALREMFGETVGQEVMKDFGDELGQAVQSGNHQLGTSGGILLPAATIISPQPKVPSNTFYGVRWPGK
ncbi:MAG: hypothetical protein OEU92_29130, partial [Alphaproteobacteria bacterium]|nr:hypothetical protein [Alphaproteobacteria bacterium]